MFCCSGCDEVGYYMYSFFGGHAEEDFSVETDDGDFMEEKEENSLETGPVVESNSFAFVVNGELNLSSFSYSRLGKMDASELRLARNAVYAFYGRAFKSSDLQKYFNAKSWYYISETYSDKLITKEHKELIARVKSFED